MTRKIKDDQEFIVVNKKGDAFVGIRYGYKFLFEPNWTYAKAFTDENQVSILKEHYKNDIELLYL
jgi:hypothetical protein